MASSARSNWTTTGAGLVDIIKNNKASLVSICENYVSYYASGDGHTAKAKRYDLKYFLEFLGGTELDLELGAWTHQATSDFIDYRLSLGESPSTVSRRLATIKHFGRTLADRVPDFVNPAKEVKAPKFNVLTPKGLPPEEVQALKEVLEEKLSEENSFLSMRKLTIVSLLLCTGLRADEVRTLVMAQLSINLDWLENVRTKGKKFRRVYVPKNCRAALEAYLAMRDAYLESKVDEYLPLSAEEKAKFPLFLSLRGGKLHSPPSFCLDPKTVWKQISDFGSLVSARFSDRELSLHPHQLRHTFAHGLLDAATDIRLVAQALGHSDVRVTMRYTERTDKEVAEAVEKSMSN